MINNISFVQTSTSVHLTGISASMETVSTFLVVTLAPAKKDIEEICVTQVGVGVILTTLNMSSLHQTGFENNR